MWKSSVIFSPFDIFGMIFIICLCYYTLLVLYFAAKIFTWYSYFLLSLKKKNKNNKKTFRFARVKLIVVVCPN